MTREYKGYAIAQYDNTVMKAIKPVGKGSVHLDLRGMYTSDREAELAIDRFLASKEKKGGKATKSS